MNATIFHNIIIIISIIGFLYHLYFINKRYFSYGTVLSAHNNEETIIDLPAITICFYKKYLIKRDIFNRYFKLINISLNTSQIEYYLNFLSVDKQHLITESFDEVFPKCEVAYTILTQIPDDIKLKCNNVSAIREFISYDLKCYSLFSQLDSQSDDNYRILKSSEDLIYIEIYSKYKIAKIHFHSRSDSFNFLIMGYEKGVNLDLNDKSPVEIFYKKTSYKLLSHPYKTNCVHYPNRGFDSQFDCKSQSMNKYFADRFDGIPGIYFADPFYISYRK
jgi:hypothetical protein